MDKKPLIVHELQEQGGRYEKYQSCPIESISKGTKEDRLWRRQGDLQPNNLFSRINILHIIIQTLLFGVITII
jgi:hypothetical protein